MTWSLAIHMRTSPDMITGWTWRDATAMSERLADHAHADAKFQAALHGMKLKR